MGNLKLTYVCTINSMTQSILFYVCIVHPPNILGGSGTLVVSRDRNTAKIGTNINVFKGTDVILICKIIGGTPPINITWFRNGLPDPTRGNVSTITITDARNLDTFKCRADNIAGFDMETSHISVKCGKDILYIYTYIYKPYFTYICTKCIAVHLQ